MVSVWSIGNRSITRPTSSCHGNPEHLLRAKVERPCNNYLLPNRVDFRLSFAYSAAQPIPAKAGRYHSLPDPTRYSPGPAELDDADDDHYCRVGVAMLPLTKRQREILDYL